MPHTLRTIQALVGGELIGNGEALISGVNTLEAAHPGDLAYAEHERYASRVRQTQASAVIVTQWFPDLPDKHLLRVPNPRAAFAQVMHLFEAKASVPQGLHPSAVIAPTAVLEADVTIGEHAVLRDRAAIGRATIIDSGTHVGAGVVIGQDCVIGPNVVLKDGTRIGHRVRIHGGSVIGGDGFGYVWAQGRHAKIPQLGHVVIEDDVEIGCNVCVDRGTLGATIIRRGTKIDNLVQVAHNNVIGEDVIITGQVGLSGSVTVGNRVVFGGQAGVIDHVTIGDDARLGIGTLVIRDVKPGETIWGVPGRADAEAKREIASLLYLPRLLKQFRELLVRVQRTETRLAMSPRTTSTPLGVESSIELPPVSGDVRTRAPQPRASGTRFGRCLRTLGAMLFRIRSKK